VLLKESNVRIQKLPKILAFKNSITFSKQHEDFIIMGANIQETNKIHLTIVFYSKNENKKNIVMKICNKLIVMEMTTQN